MKLVIDKPQLEQVTMCIGSLEMPMSREQVVEMLFGSDWRIVPASQVEVTQSKRRKRRTREEMQLAGAQTERLLPPAPKDKYKSPIFGAVLGFLNKKKTELTSPEIRDALPAELLKGKPQAYLAGVLTKLAENNDVVRSGKRGTYRYTIASNGSARHAAAAADDAPPPSRTSENRRAVADARMREGLCSRGDGRKLVAGKRLCRKCLDQIRVTQQRAVKAKIKARRSAS